MDSGVSNGLHDLGPVSSELWVPDTSRFVSDDVRPSLSCEIDRTALGVEHCRYDVHHDALRRSGADSFRDRIRAPRS
jgi:hypothetical protein